MMVSQLYPLARDFEEALDAALQDGKSWCMGERAALRRIRNRGTPPVVRTRRRWFYVTRGHTFVIERTRGGGFRVLRIAED